MHDCYRVSTWISIIFFTSYFIAGRIFLLNLFIAVILENFSDVAEEYEAPVTPLHLRQFVEAWADFDLRSAHTPTKASYTMSTVNLMALLMAVPPPLGLCGTEVDRAQVLKRVRELHVPDHEGVVHLHEVLYACAQYVCGVALSDKEHETRIGARATKAFPTLQELRDKRPAKQEVANFYAASYVQAAWRGFVARGLPPSPLPSTSKAQRAAADRLSAAGAIGVGAGRVAPWAPAEGETAVGAPHARAVDAATDAAAPRERWPRELPPLRNPPLLRPHVTARVGAMAPPSRSAVISGRAGADLTSAGALYSTPPRR